MSEIIIYSTLNNGGDDKLQEIIGSIDSEYAKEFYHSIDNLIKRLRKPIGGDTIGLFITADRQELLELLSVQYLFRNIRIVLVLPDREDYTVSKGYSLRPRYLGYSDGDLSDVAAVMGKMVCSTYHQPDLITHENKQKV